MLNAESHPGPTRPLFLSPEAELRRLDRHFRRVLETLHRAPPPGLGPAARRARGRRLEALERYRRNRTFPKNRAFPGLMVPIFVDAEGTHCAMGQLIAEAGGADLVQHVRETMNFARIAQMGGIEGLAEWLERNGLTAEEAAMIQPSYCDAAADCVCMNLPTTILEGTILVADTSVTVTAVHGTSQGVAVGDTVMLTGPSQGVAGDHVIVNYHPFYYPEGVEVQWVVPASGELAIGQCNFYGVPPGPLPASVWVEAVTAGGKSACFDVLEKEDPGWTTRSGDGCNSSGSSSSSSGGWTTIGSGNGGDGNGGGSSIGTASTGCGVQAGDAPGSALALVMLAGLCVVHGLRRTRR